MVVKLTESDKKFIRAYVAEGRNEEERRMRRRECAEQFGVKLSIVSAVTAWTKIWSDKGIEPPEKTEQPLVVEVEEVKEETKEEVTAVVEVTEEPPTEELTEEEVERIEAVDGAHADYDNPIKQVWRERWKSFIAKQTTLYERDRMKVLCLPGKRCLEVPVYLDLGFKPCNIFGVEGGDEAARREFSENAETYGIVQRVGRLENLLPKMKETFDIISLDFPGPLSKTCLDIVKMLPLAPTGDATSDTKSLFMINLMAKRETKETQQFLDFYASFDRPEIKQMLNGPNQGLDRFKDVCRYMNDLEDKVYNGEKVYESADLMEKRNSGLVFILTSLIAADRRSLESRWRNYNQQAPNFSRKEFGNATQYVLAALLENLSPFVKQKALDFLTVGVPHMLAMVGNYKPFVYDIEQYQYTSPVINRNGRVGNSPYFTEMYRLLTPMTDYGKARFFIRFFMDAICWKACHPRKHIFLDVRNKQGHVKAPCDGLDQKDTIEFIDRDGALISSIPWQKVTDTYKLIVSHIGNDKVTNILTEGQISRINLN
jgi:hypothetical protein